MMLLDWFKRVRRLRELGILGMNRRNAEAILDLNPRRLYPLVDSKYKMYELCKRIGVPTPAILGVIPAHSVIHRLPEVVADHPDFVIKPNRGAGGRGILVVVGRDADRFVRHNGQRLALGDVKQHVSSVISGLYSLGGHTDEALFQQRVMPHPAFERISYGGIGDIRVILYKMVPAMAMLRLPTKLSGGRANLHQGGIGAGVDLDTGLTARAVFRNHLTEKHPDTGASIVGFRVPDWPVVIDMARKVAAEVGLGYIGVDVVVDRDHGPQLLEANARPGLAIQIANGRGLLRRFAEIDRALELAPPAAQVPAHLPAPERPVPAT